jgi:hypothetical protein
LETELTSRGLRTVRACTIATTRFFSEEEDQRNYDATSEVLESNKRAETLKGGITELTLTCTLYIFLGYKTLIVDTQAYKLQVA